MQKEKDHSVYNIKSTEVARKDDLMAGSEKSDFVSKALVDYRKQSAEGMGN